MGSSGAEKFSPIVCIVGPTASGKSELAQLFAESAQGEVVSADSMQIYKGMDIGTGKVVPADQRVPHFGLDLVNPGDAFSASLFQKYARNCFRDIETRGHVPVLCGGTGFYVRAAIDDYQFPEGEQENNPIRDKYMDMANELGNEAVWEELNRLDPTSAQAVHPNNVKRVVRALEMHAQGVSYADQLEALQNIPQVVPALMVGLSVDRETLYQRINKRVDDMFASGLVDEVASLLKSGYLEGLTAQQAIGYKEIVAYLQGDDTIEDAKDKIKQATRRYAKRQISWFKRDARVHWLDATDYDATNLQQQCLDLWCEFQRE